MSRVGHLFALGLAVCLVAPVVAHAAEPVPKPHLVYVALQREDGRIVEETQVRCDLALSCEVAVHIGHPQLDSMALRIFAEDRGGFSVVPTGSGRDGKSATGRRRDFGWGATRTAEGLIPARPLKPWENETLALFGVDMREDGPPFAHVIVAVKDLRPSGSDYTH
jgi:hypothetical protein